MMASWRLVVWGKRVCPRLRLHYAPIAELPANDRDEHEVSNSNADGRRSPLNGILSQTNSSKAADEGARHTRRLLHWRGNRPCHECEPIKRLKSEIKA
jgi:hypothetical protein